MFVMCESKVTNICSTLINYESCDWIEERRDIKYWTSIFLPIQSNSLMFFFFLTINSEKVWYMGWKSEPKWAVFYETICRQFNSFRRPNCNPCYANCKSSYPPFTQISEKVKGIYIHRQELSVPSISVPRLQH